MASLKELRDRITSVKNTRKITSAMKMVSAAKLRRAQEAAQASRPYAERMERVLGSLASAAKGGAGADPMMVGTGKEDTHLIIVVSSDRGLCGGFNSFLVRETRALIKELQGAGKSVKLYTAGRKGRDQLKRTFGDALVKSVIELDKPRLSFDKASAIADDVQAMFANGEFDVCHVVYSKFQSAISQVPTRQQLIPFPAPEVSKDAEANDNTHYEYEPDQEAILADLLPRNLSVQIFKALLESSASEQGARMTAMENATRNAGEMINKLTLLYNRSRQAQITNELIEIVAGAEAL